MPAVFLQEFAVEDAEFGQQPGEQRHFEDQAHDENHAEEVAHVGVEGNLVGHSLADPVFGEKPERKRENQTVSHCAAEEKHECSRKESLADGPSFAFEQGRLYEFPEFEYDIREKKQQRHPERGRDMRHELRRDVDIDDVY